jgi:phage tail protein X
MPEIYQAKDGDMIDEICWRYYERGQQPLAVERVYEANHGLARQGPKLVAGTRVVLPDLPRPASTPIIRIWGVG